MENGVYHFGIIQNEWDKGTAVFEDYFLKNIRKV